MSLHKKHSRRDFVKNSAAATAGITVGLNILGIPKIQNVLGANDKIRLGFIGVGNRGTQLLTRFQKQPEVEVVAICDIYEPYLQRDNSKVDKRIIDSIGNKVPTMDETLPENVGRYKDFRQMLDRKDIDAVVISTQDHWHAIQTVMSVDAGKDVYVEKPLTMTVAEGRKIIKATEGSKQIISVGMQRRSLPVALKVVDMIKNGKIGRVTSARSLHSSNMFPSGIGKFPDTEPPAGFDWDMWLGPKPMRPFRYNIAPYKYRWWKEYDSQIANNGVHYLDVMRWALGDDAPLSVNTVGGKYVVDDDRTIPDTMEVTFEMPSGAIITWSLYEGSGNSPLKHGYAEFRGTKGNLYIDHWGYQIEPSGGGQFQEDAVGWNEPKKPRTQAVEVDDYKDDSTTTHIRNFLDCVKSREKPNCDLETGHLSAVFAHLANISLETRSRLEWDAKNERVTNNEQANNLLHYEYRKPWKVD